MKNKIILVFFSLIVGLSLGYYIGSFTVPVNISEISDEKSEYQFIPSKADVVEALESGNYSHCVVYSGVGLTFGQERLDGSLVIEQALIGDYPTFNTPLGAGVKVLTPIDILRGDLGSPVKIDYVSKWNGKKESIVLKRVPVKKCLKKGKQDNFLFKNEF